LDRRSGKVPPLSAELSAPLRPLLVLALRVLRVLRGL
jgi:hypothetical protein